MVRPLRHRQTKGAATDMPDLTPPRHIPTLPISAVRLSRLEGQLRVRRANTAVESEWSLRFADTRTASDPCASASQSDDATRQLAGSIPSGLLAQIRKPARGGTVNALKMAAQPKPLLLGWAFERTRPAPAQSERKPALCGSRIARHGTRRMQMSTATLQCQNATLGCA